VFWVYVGLRVVDLYVWIGLLVYLHVLETSPCGGGAANFFVDRLVHALHVYIKLYSVIYVRGWRTVSGCTRAM
jgi:hypothetical protein